MNVLDTFLSPVGRLAASAQNAFDDAIIGARKRREEEKLQEALSKVADLEQQKKQAENPQVPLRPQTFGRPEELELFQAYGQAGLDPKAVAEAQTARLAAEAFAKAIPNVQSDVGRINIGLGKEYKPDVYRQQATEADEMEWRLKTLQENLPSDPLLAVDALNKKQLFTPIKASVEGEDGKTHQAMVTATPDGKFNYNTVTDAATQQPLVIPTEGSDQPSEVRIIKWYADTLQIPEAEAIKIYRSKVTDTPQAAWQTITKSFSKSKYGANVKPYDMLNNAMLVWEQGWQGSPLPVDVEKLVNSYDLNKKQKQDLLARAETINANAVAANPPTIPTATPTAPVAAIPQPRPTIPQARPVPMPQPQAASQPLPKPELQPLTPVAIQSAWTAIQRGKKPEEVQKALVDNGFDISPESVNIMAIDAVNSGVPANVLQQYLASIGIEWQPPG